MRWVKIAKTFHDDVQVYGRIDDDGLMRVTASESNTALSAWLEEGNVAEEWNPEGAE
jgi:hypothetical protein